MIIDHELILSLSSFAVKPLESVLYDSKEKLKWYPVMEFGPYESVLGISFNGYWVVKTKNGLHIMSEASSFWKLVILLEEPIEEVKKKMSEALNLMNIKVNINNLFPFVEIVRAGFNFGTKHWAEMAFQWYDKLPTNKKKELEELLVSIKNAKWATQQLRHKAQKELKRLAQY